MIAHKILWTGLGLLALLTWGCQRPTTLPKHKNKTATQPTTATVDVALPKVVTTQEALKLSGTIEPWQRAKIYSRTPGYIKEMNVDIGQRVKKGDILSTIAVPELEARALQAKAEYDKSQAQAALANVSYQRLKKIKRQMGGAVTDQDLDLAKAEWQVAKAGAGVAKARWQGIRARTAYRQVIAPFDALVAARSVDVGALVGGDNRDNAAVVELLETDPVRLVVFIPERAAQKIHPGMPVRFSFDAFSGEQFNSTISRMAHALDTEHRNMRAEIDIPNAKGHLIVGMYAHVYLQPQGLTNAFDVPARAVHHRDGKNSVWVVENSIVKEIPVRIVNDLGARIVLRGLLTPQSQLIVSSPQSLHIGQRIQISAKQSS